MIKLPCRLNDQSPMTNDQRMTNPQCPRNGRPILVIGHSTLVILWSLVIGSLVICRAADWPQFRGPGAAGASSEKNLPVEWSETENIRWKAELPGRGLSSPVVVGGKVFVTACSGVLQERLHVLCFDARSGEKQWERQLWATGSTMCNPKTCMAAPTPVADSKHVFALFATADLVAYDLDGTLLWYRSLSRDYPGITNQVGMAASPALAGPTLLVPMENAGRSFVAALDKHTGKNRWLVERERDINWVSPAVIANGQRTEVLFQSKGELSAYDPLTGEKRWRYEAEGLSTIPSPLGAGELVLAPGNGLAALKPRPDGGTPEVVWKSTRLSSGYASPAVYLGRVYVIAGGGVLNCADLADGKVLWQQRVKGPFSASPVVGDGKVYVVNEEGLTTVVQIGAEPKVLATNDLKDPMLATPAIADGGIFLRSDKCLYCIGGKR